MSSLSSRTIFILLLNSNETQYMQCPIQVPLLCAIVIYHFLSLFECLISSMQNNLSLDEITDDPTNSFAQAPLILLYLQVKHCRKSREVSRYCERCLRSSRGSSSLIRAEERTAGDKRGAV